jgi:hypothetical protein
LKQLFEINVHIIIRFENVWHFVTLLAKPLEQHQRLDCQVGVRVDEPFLQDVPVRLALRRHVTLKRRVFQLPEKKYHFDVGQFQLKRK